MWGKRWRGLARRLALTAGSLLVVFLALELSLRLYLRATKQSSIYHADMQFGHFTRPNLDVEKRLPDGRVIRIVTDARGNRIAPGEDPSHVVLWRRPNAKRRILILGDSYAEATVNIEDRLDRLMETARPDWSVALLGCGGFGPDQEIVLGRHYFGELRRGDVLIVLSCGNDFRDILCARQFGRARARFTLENGKLIEHAPRITWVERLRERSCVAAAVIGRVRPDRFGLLTEDELARSQDLYRALIRSLKGEMADRGVFFGVAYHSNWVDPRLRDAYPPLRDIDHIACLSLEEAVGTPTANPENCMLDGHWTPRGYRIVTDELIRFVDQLTGETPATTPTP
jgi:hypothetical protein